MDIAEAGRRYLKWVPAELLLGLFTAGLLMTVLAVQIWLIGVASVTPLVAAWLAERTVWLVLLTVALGIVVWLVRTVPSVQAYAQAAGWAVFASYVGLYWVLYSHLVTLVFSVVQVERVAAVSLLLLQIDEALGVYEWLGALIQWLVGQPGWYLVFEAAYTYTLQVVGMMVFGLVLYSASVARAYLLAGMVTLVLSIPIWLFSPAIAPYQLSSTDSLSGTTVAAEIAAEAVVVTDLYNQHQDTAWGAQTQFFTTYWETVSESFGYAVSSNPSTHIALGVLLLVYAWRVSRWLGVLAGVFLLFEGVGTLLFLQHYLIDIPMGVLVALLAVWVSDQIVRSESAVAPTQTDDWFAPLLALEQIGGLLRAASKR